MISYQEYLNLLNHRKLDLFDFQKRISYFRLKNLYNNQTAGGANSSKDFRILESHNLQKLVTLLNYNDLKSAKNIINLFC
jgi:hypothetical protein